MPGLFPKQMQICICIFQFPMILVNNVITLFPGILFQLFPCILLNFLFISLRINADGYHADSPEKCYVNSTIMIAVLLAIIKWIPMLSIALVVLVAISSIINLIFSSVENVNHQIDKTIYQKRNLIVFVQSSVNAENVLKKYVA